MAKSVSLELIMTTRDKASGGLRAIKGQLVGVGSAAGSAHGPTNLLQQALSVAGGLGIVEGIKSVAGAVKGLATEAFGAVASHERLSLSMESLMAREIKNTQGISDMSRAMELAKKPAAELVNWTEMLAVESPFGQEGVATALRTAMAYGFTADEAKRLTQANIDYAAASGQGAEVMDRIALALGQIKAKGKLAGQEVLQLTNAGLPVRDILARAFNVTTAELQQMQEKGLIPADKAVEAITRSLEEDFGGAAKKQAGSLAGLTESLQDLKSIALREVFTGAFQAAQPYIATVVDTLSDPEFRATLNEIGGALGGAVATGLQQVSVLIGPLLPQVSALFGQAMASAPEIMGRVSGALVYLQSIWTSVWPVVQATFQAVWPLLQDAFVMIGPLVQQAGAIIQQVIADVAPLVQKVVTEAAALIQANLPQIQAIISEALTAIKIIWDAVWPYLQVVLEIMWEGAKTVVQTAINVVRDIVRTVMALLRGDWEGVWKGIEAIVLDVWEGIKGIIGHAIEGVRKLFKDVDWGALGRGIVDGITNGVLAVAGGLVSAATKVVGDALQAAKNLLGIHSPSRVAAEQIGKPFAAGIGQGILAGMERLTGTQMPGLMGQLVGAGSVGGGWGGGTTPLQVQLVYAPTISFASREEAYDLAEQFLAEVERRRGRRG